jgi:hypothetical protein
LTVPEEKIGKICKSLEKYFDPKAGRIRVKSRPALIIGCEDDYVSPMNVDYEILPISTMKNRTPNPTYDEFLGDNKYDRLGLSEACYIRTHKTTWNHVRHMETQNPIGDLKAFNSELFTKILNLNNQWVTYRNNSAF